MIRIHSSKFLTLVLAASLTVAPVSAISFGSIFSQARTYTASMLTRVKNNAVPIAALLASVAAMAIGKSSGYSYLQSAAIGSMVISAGGIYFNQHSLQENKQNVALDHAIVDTAKKNDQIPLNIPTQNEKTKFYKLLMLEAMTGLNGKSHLGAPVIEMLNRFNDEYFTKLVTDLHFQVFQNESAYMVREFSDEEFREMKRNNRDEMQKVLNNKNHLSEEEAYTTYPLLTEIRIKLLGI